MKKLITVVLLVAVAGVGSWFFFTPKPAAPLVTFETLQDESLTMASLRGKVVLVKFWATSCVTCVQQMPDTIELYNDLHDNGLEVVAVAMDYDPIEFVRNFVAARKLPFVIAPDKSGEVAKAFGDVKLTPIAFLVDRDGRIVKRYLGVYDKQDMRKTVEKALAG
jgi:peroxiredoxin